MVFANQCPGSWSPVRAAYDAPVSPMAGSPPYTGGGPAKTGCSEVEAEAVIDVLLAATASTHAVQTANFDKLFTGHLLLNPAAPFVRTCAEDARRRFHGSFMAGWLANSQAGRAWT
jgi:hypothetical protein